MNGQCARVLEVLADGQSHSVTEIHRLAGTMRLNSRVSELRKHLRERGETIICTRAGGLGPDSYLYTLVPLRAPEEPVGAGCSSGARSESSAPLQGVTERGSEGDVLNASQLEEDPRSEDAEVQLEIDWIDRELDGVIGAVNPAGAREKRETLLRQRSRLEGLLA